jgi:hypothetical protein
VSALAEHWLHEAVSQSIAQPVLWSHVVDTNGATHRKMPVASVSGTSKGERHDAHEGLVAFSNAK